MLSLAVSASCFARGKTRAGTRVSVIPVELAAKCCAVILKVQVIAMRGVVIGGQHGAEALARRCVDGAEELADLRIGRVPILGDADSPPVLQFERADIDRIADRMPRSPRGARDVAARIASHALDSREF